MRRAARRNSAVTRGIPAIFQAVGGRAVRRGCRWVPFGSLPHPVGVAFAAASWSTVLTLAWLMAWVLPDGGLPVGDAGASVRGQEFAAAAWMMHFAGWCGAACRRLDRNRGGARAWRAADAQSLS